jgi:bifunctional oligoribonuclease and PAP phosphatase NrnA
MMCGKGNWLMSELVANEATYREAAARLWSPIAQAQRIICPFHINSDPDAVGSALGAYHLLTGIGKEVIVYASDGDFPHITEFLPGAARIVRYAGEALPAADLILALDSSDEGRLGALYTNNAARFIAGPSVMIDHHLTNSLFGTNGANFVDAKAAATAEMLALLAHAWGLPISPAAATCLLAGLYGDTLGLQTTSVTPRTYHVAGDLLAAGADLTAIVNHFYRSRPFTTIKLWGAILSAAAWQGSVVWSQVTPTMVAEANAEESDTGGVINFLTGAVGARAIVLLYRGDNEWRAGLRTLVDEVDVAAIAARFGGGGHRKAAGCRIEGGEAERDAFLRAVDALSAEQVGATATIAP